MKETENSQASTQNSLQDELGQPHANQAQILERKEKGAQDLTRATLTEGDIAKHLYTMAFPMAIGILATMSLNVIDTYFISQLGDDSLAAISFAFPVIFLIISLAIGLGAGTSSVVARAAGEGDEKNVRGLITDSMSLTAILTILMSVAGLFSIEPLFMALGAEPHIIPLIREYMVIWYISITFFSVPMVGLAALRALGSAKLQGSMMLSIAVANAILDPFLIFGWWIFPRMEIEGAALATLIVRVCSLFVLFYWMHVKFKLLVNPFCMSRLICSTRKIMHVGIPAMATNMIIPVSGALVISIVATYGSEAVAGFGVATRIESIALIGFYALSAVIGPFCGQNLGGKKFDRLKQGQWVILKFSIASGLFLAVVLALFGKFIAYQFTKDDKIVEVIYGYLLVVPLSYFGYGVIMSVCASFNGMSRPMPGVVISAARVFIVLFPLIGLFGVMLGINGIFLAISISNIIVGIIAFFWVHHAIKKIDAAN